MKRLLGITFALVALFSFGVTTSLGVTAQTSDNTKYFVCKYVGTPGVDERLQTGQNPIDIGGGSLPQPVVVGTFFNDSQGRSFILAEDVGQPDPDVSECPPPDTGSPPPPTPTPTLPPTPTPTPTPVATPTPTPIVTPTPTPVITPTPTPAPTGTPVAGQFSIATCPTTGEPVPVGQSAISIRGGLLLILLLHVRVDGVEVSLIDVLGDGSVGEVFVTPGSHEVTISNAADTAVLFDEVVDCPTCNPASPTPPPGAPSPTPHVTPPPTDTVSGSTGAGGGMLLTLLGLAAIASLVLFVTPRPKQR